MDAPDLRIVSEALWERVHERLAGVRAQYERVSLGKLWGRPASGVESRFLLTGFAVCGACGGSLGATSRISGRARVYVYGCTTYERKGAAVCSNSHLLPVVATDEALLETLETDLLDPAVIARTIEKAMADLRRDETGASARGEALSRELGTVEAQLGRLTQAIVMGGNLAHLVAEMQRLETSRATLRAESDAIARLSERAGGMAPEKVLGLIEEALSDCRGLLTRQTAEGRAILRELLVNRVVYTPRTTRQGRACEFTADCSLGRILQGVVATNGGGPNGIRRGDVLA